MKHEYFRVTPVSEAPNEKGGYFVIMEDDSICAKDFNGKQFEPTFIGSKKVKAWLSPVSVVMPEDVSDDAIDDAYQDFAGRPDIEGRAAAKKMRDTLIPAFAEMQATVKTLEDVRNSLWVVIDQNTTERIALRDQATALQERVNKLEDEAVGMTEAGTIQAERIKELEEAVEDLLRFTNPDGSPVDGFRFREAAIKLSALTTKPHTVEEKADHISDPGKEMSAEERDSLDLLELVCQLHHRSLNAGTKEMHDAYVEARNELEQRLSPAALEQGREERANKMVHYSPSEKLLGRICLYLQEQEDNTAAELRSDIEKVFSKPNHQ